MLTGANRGDCVLEIRVFSPVERKSSNLYSSFTIVAKCSPVVVVLGVWPLQAEAKEKGRRRLFKASQITAAAFISLGAGFD